MARFTADVSWLPKPVFYDPQMPSVDAYLKSRYYIFYLAFYHGSIPFIYFRGKTLVEMASHGGEAASYQSFRHFISKDPKRNGPTIEEERLIDFARAARVSWVKPLIRRVDEKDKKLKYWERKHKGRWRLCIALEDFSYVVIGEFANNKRNLVILITAYPIPKENKHGRSKLEKQYKRYQRENFNYNF